MRHSASHNDVTDQAKVKEMLERMEGSTHGTKGLMEIPQRPGASAAVSIPQPAAAERPRARSPGNSVHAGDCVRTVIGRGVMPNEDNLRSMLKSLLSRGRRERWLLPPEDLRNMEAEPFAAGQFGTVTRATWRGMRVVCKRSKESMGEAPGVSREAAELEALRALVDWGNELDLLTTLRHPNLVMFLGACISENGLNPPPLFVIEYMSNGNLEDLLRKNPDRPLSKKRCHTLAIEFARGMSFLHGCHPPVVHRDLKPANMLFDADMHLRIADFGTSRMMSRPKGGKEGEEGKVGEAPDGCGMTGETGTYRYMAPEVFRNENYGPKADVYSFAIILWYAHAGQVPFMFKDPHEVAREASMEGLRPDPEVFRRCKVAKMTMPACWSALASDRPNFEEILTVFEEIGTITPPNKGWFFKPKSRKVDKPKSPKRPSQREIKAAKAAPVAMMPSSARQLSAKDSGAAAVGGGGATAGGAGGAAGGGAGIGGAVSGRAGSGTGGGELVEDDGPDKTEETCAFLLYACQRGDMVSVRKLCARAGADVLPTIADYDLRTPLHIASACGHEGIVRYLLRHGCKRDAVDRFGNVPRDDAVRSEFPVISALFDTDYGDVGTFDANVDGEDDMVVKTAQLIAPGTPPGPVSALHATEQQAGGGVGSKGKKGKGKECLLQ